MKKLILLMLLLPGLTVYAKTYEKVIQPKKEMIEFGFDNVAVEEIEFYDGKQIIIKSNRDDVIYTEKKHYIGIASPKKAKIYLQLPENLHYQTAYDDGMLYFDNNIVTLNGSDPSKIEMNGSTLVVYEDGDVITLYQNGDLHVKQNEEEEILIKSDGFWERESWGTGDYILHEDLGGFWGKALAAVIGVAVRTVMNLVGDTPAEVTVSVLKENSWKGNVETVMGNIPKSKMNLNRDRFTRTESVVMETHDIETLSIDNFNGKIEIEGVKGGNLEANITITSEEEKNLDNVEIKTQDLNLISSSKIFHSKKNLQIYSKPLIKNPKCSVNYEIKLPDNLKLKIIESSNGTIKIESCSGDGEFETSNGRIEVEDYSGNIEIQTSNGGIDLENIKGNVIARTSNGRIEAENVTGMINARTSNGKIELMDCSVIEEIHTSNSSIYAEIIEIKKYTPVFTTNGSITIVLPNKGSFDIQAVTSNGAIDTHDIDIVDMAKRKTKLKAKYNGGGNSLDIETSNANIEIYQKNI